MSFSRWASFENYSGHSLSELEEVVWKRGKQSRNATSYFYHKDTKTYYSLYNPEEIWTKNPEMDLSAVEGTVPFLRED